MRSTIPTLCFLILAQPTLAHGCSKHAQVQDPSKNIDVRFDVQDNVLTLNEPVVVVFKVHNGTAAPIKVTVGALVRQFFDFSLTTPEGQIQRKDPFDKQIDIVTIGSGNVIVQPGSDYMEPLVMNQWFAFDSVGSYALTARLTSDIETADGNFQVGPQVSRIEVRRRDPSRLSKKCAELERQVESADSVDAARFPALALSYIRDPIAAPYLGRVLLGHTLAYQAAVSGLERIASDESVEILLSALNDGYGDISQLATMSLGRMLERIRNERLKETVKRAVTRSVEQQRDNYIRTQISYLDYRSPVLQKNAIQNLMQVQDGLQQAEAVLQRLAKDPNQPTDVRAAAQKALGKLHPLPNE